MNTYPYAVGDRVTYYAPATLVGERPHYPAIVEKIGKRVTVRIFREDAPPPSGKRIVVGKASLGIDQIELLDETAAPQGPEPPTAADESP